MSTTEQPTQAIERRESKPPIPLYNEVLSPDKWTLFGRIAQQLNNTDFVPKSLRGKPEAVMACLLYGDSLGLHPSVSLSDVYVADGSVGLKGALMIAKIREAGHKVTFEEVLDDNGAYVGAKAIGKYIVDGEVVEEDEWTFTMEDAKAAGLLKPNEPKASWTVRPKVMCRWRAVSQLARFLFPDVFRGHAVYTPDEAEQIADEQRRMRNAGAPGDSAGGEEIQYGDDPLLAAWLIALFAAVNEMEPGAWLPKKQALALNGKTQEDREAVAQSLVEWLEERGAVVPSRPTDEDEIVHEGEVVIDSTQEGQPEDDPGPHLNGDDQEHIKLD
jgi:hypothetical protein